MENPFLVEDFDMQDIRGDSYAAMPPVTKILRLEGVGYFLLALALYYVNDFSWTQFGIWFFLPDIAILAYVFANTTIGAYCYNATHSCVGAALVGIFGVLSDNLLCQQMGLIWFAHIGFDRALGHGLKYRLGFRVTHLGLLTGIHRKNIEVHQQPASKVGQ